MVLLIGRMFPNSRQSFIGDPYKVILTLILVIGVSRIIGASSTNQQSLDLTPIDIETRDSLRTFTSSEYGVNFVYPSNWTKQTPQRKATLILLYESLGTEATCNLSVIAQDQQTVENYNTDYFKNNLPKIYKSVDNIETHFETINNKKVSLTTYEFQLQAKIQMKSTTVTTLHNGRRFMLIINVPGDNEYLIKDDIKAITESLRFE